MAISILMILDLHMPDDRSMSRQQSYPGRSVSIPCPSNNGDSRQRHLQGKGAFAGLVIDKLVFFSLSLSLCNLANLTTCVLQSIDIIIDNIIKKYSIIA